MAVNLYDEVKRRRDLVRELRDPAQDDRDYEEYKKQVEKADEFKKLVDEALYFSYLGGFFEPKKEEPEKKFKLAIFESYALNKISVYDLKANHFIFTPRASNPEDNSRMLRVFLDSLQESGYFLEIDWINLDA